MGFRYSATAYAMSPQLSRDNKMAIELFLTGVRGWEAGLRRRLGSQSD
jgi:hypothetical protein